VCALLSVVDACVNSPFTSLIDNEISHPERYDISRMQYLNATREAYLRDQSCDRIPITSYTPLHMRTLCPWEYVYDTDMDRFPPVLITAKCKCATCLDNYRCKPVFYTVHVLKKQCTDGVIRWARKTQLISVACTCVQPTVHEVSKRLSKLFRIPIKKQANAYMSSIPSEVNNLYELDDIYSQMPPL